MTKRDLYYTDPRVYRDQKQSNAILDTVSALLGADRSQLHIVRSQPPFLFRSSRPFPPTGSKQMGSVRGLIQSDTLTWTLNEQTIRCREVVPISPFVHQISAMNGAFAFILVVEKETVFQHLSAQGFTRKFPCVLVTGKGFPCIATRQMVHALSVQFQSVPVFALVDADIYGLEIFATYKYGSARGRRDAAVPRIQCIGVFLSDLQELNVLSTCALRPSIKDMSRIDVLLRREWVCRDELIRGELLRLKEWGVKAEIEGLLQREPGFLVNTYLPRKLGLPARRVPEHNDSASGVAPSALSHSITERRNAI